MIEWAWRSQLGRRRHRDRILFDLSNKKARSGRPLRAWCRVKNVWVKYGSSPGYSEPIPTTPWRNVADVTLSKNVAWVRPADGWEREDSPGLGKASPQPPRAGAMNLPRPHRREQSAPEHVRLMSNHYRKLVAKCVLCSLQLPLVPQSDSQHDRLLTERAFSALRFFRNLRDWCACLGVRLQSLDIGSSPLAAKYFFLLSQLGSPSALMGAV